MKFFIIILIVKELQELFILLNVRENCGKAVSLLCNKINILIYSTNHMKLKILIPKYTMTRTNINFRNSKDQEKILQ